MSAGPPDGNPDVDDFLEQPALPRDLFSAPSRLFNPQDIVAGRFQIVRFIGHGGMGDVYEATDTELGTPVALKTIRPEFASDNRAIERFRREVLQARSIGHPGVCRVFDLFTHDTGERTVRFLTMELIAGVTLAERLRERGPMDETAARPLLDQIAAALTEAHRRQVVHRDLKPGNVMLVSDHDGTERAVITDFGLSVRVRQSGWSDVSASERHAGTDDYTAPEQRAGGLVGPPADVFAFGVLMHEVLTGRAPSQIESDNSVPQAARIPLAWRKAIRRCTDPDPAKRPKSADAAMKIVRGQRPWRAVLTTAAVLILAAVALTEPISRLLGGTRPSIRSVVLATVDNQTSQEDLGAVTEMLRYQIQQSTYLTVLDPGEVSATLGRMVVPDGTLSVEHAREVAWRRNLDGIISGGVTGDQAGLVLTLRLESRGPSPDRPGRVRSRSFEARDRTELQGLVQSAAAWIRSTAGEPAGELAGSDRPVEDVTSSSWQAVALFSRAQALAASSKPDDALALLGEAVRQDPDFALAWMRMGDILYSQRRTAEGYIHWQRALDVFRRRHVSPREEFRIRGLFASDSEDFGEAERIYRSYMLSFPNDFEPYFYIARPLQMLNRFDEAIAMLEQARAKSPSAFSVPAQLAMARLQAGRLDEVAKDLADLRAMTETDWADCLEGQLAFLRGQPKEALEKFAALRSSKVPFLRGREPALMAAVFGELGQADKAIEHLRRGVEADLQSGDRSAQADKLLSLAALQLAGHDKSACRDSCLRAVQVDQSPARAATAAALLAQAGFAADAERIAKTLPGDSASRRVQADRIRVAAEIALARGQKAAAWTQFQAAARLEAPAAMPEYFARASAAAGENGIAIAAYERIALNPGHFWQYPDWDPPGTWRRGVESYLALSRARPGPNRSRVEQLSRSLLQKPVVPDPTPQRR